MNSGMFTPSIRQPEGEALDKYHEEEHLGLFLTGEKLPVNWTTGHSQTSFYQLKAFVGLVLKRLGFDTASLHTADHNNAYLGEGIRYLYHDIELCQFGSVDKTDTPDVRHR